MRKTTSIEAVSTEPITRLLLVRHGEVEAKYQRVFGGRIDMALSPRGVEQAQRVAEHLRGVRLDAIYASPMKRAQQTLAPIVALNGHQPITLQGLREVDFGAWTGLAWEQVKERFGLSAFQWLTELDRGGIPEAESPADYRARTEDCLRQILGGNAGRTVAIVCHGGVIRMLLAQLLALPLPRMAGFEIDYASMTLVHCRPHKTEVQFLNFTPWRDLL